MGIELENPIILGASNLTSDLDNLKKAEELGFAAITFKSLFEEQIQLERLQLDEKLTEFDDIHAEMLTTHPHVDYSCYDDHLFHLQKAKESLSIPVFASLNAVNDDTWITYARLLAETGVDGIELNFYKSPTDFDKTAQELEKEQIQIVKTIKQTISIPVSVKLSTDYTNILNHIQNLDRIGADAVVLFNSFFQPDIDIIQEKHIKSFNFSHEGDYKKSLRYSGILFGKMKADICSSHGIFTGSDVLKLILSGSSSVQLVSAIYKNGLEHIKTIRKEIEEWMDIKNYNSIDEFKGKLSNMRISDTTNAYKRAQYVDLLINSEDIFGVNR